MQGDAPRQRNMHFPYLMTHNSEQITLEETSVEKDLGAYVDKDLNCHIQQVIAKANNLLGLIRSMKYLNNESLKCLYTSLVRPHP